MGTKSEELAKLARGEGCLGKAADNEPVFILRAQDKTAANLVRQWAEFASGRLGYNHPKVVEAYEVAVEMDRWPNRKYPD